MAIAVTLAAGGITSATAKTKLNRARGWLTGQIIFVGGPPPPPGEPKGLDEGWVHVRSGPGRPVSLTHVSAGEQFKISLPMGTYEAFASQIPKGDAEGCKTTRVKILPGRETAVTLDLGCLVP